MLKLTKNCIAFSVNIVIIIIEIKIKIKQKGNHIPVVVSMQRCGGDKNES